MPDSLLPPNATAQERAMEQSTARLGDVPVPIADLWDANTCPEALLPWLAWSFGIASFEGWSLADTTAKKRAIIQQAIALHRIKGTPGAVKNALQTLSVNADIVQWWQESPPAAPCTFVVEAQVTDQPAGAPAIDAPRIEQIRASVGYWKRASRHFTLRVGLGMQSAFYAAGVFSGAQILTTNGTAQ